MTNSIKAALFTSLLVPGMAFAGDGPINIDSFYDFEKTLVTAEHASGIAGVNAELEQSPSAAESAETFGVSLDSSGDL